MILGNALLNRKILMVMIAVVAAFSPMLNAGFVNYDDPDHIINNVYVQEPSLDHLLSVFQGDACILYVPVTTCSYYLDMFFGGTPAGFHLINIVFHLFNCLLLWKLLRNLKVSESIRFLLLVFFALDPVVTESVCWATERKDVLYTFFLLASAIFFLKEQERGTLKCYYASLFLFILSCLSKPMAVSFPFIAALYLYVHGKLKTNVLKLIPFIFVSLLVCCVTYYFIVIKHGPVAETPFREYTPFQKIFLFISEAGFYFSRHWWPQHISLFHFYPVASGLYTLKTIMCFFFGLTCIFCLCYFRQSKRMTALLIAWLIMLLPVLQLVPNSQSYVNERCFYLTLVFPVYFVALLLRKLLSKQRIVLLSYSLLVIFSLLTFNQSGRWKNTETLFGYELSLDNKNCTALNILGYYYNSTGEYEKAKSLLARALVIDSLDASSLNNYGWSLYATGKTAEAISLLKKSLLLKNNFLEAHNNLGLCYLRCEEKEKALEQFRIAEQISPGQKDVMFNLGIIYYHTSDRSLGLTYLRKAAARGHERAREFLKKCDTHNLTSGK